MKLVDSVAPMPREPIVSPVRCADGLVLRTVRWQPGPAQDVAGTVVICMGRSEFVEKYFETVGDLLARGFCVLVFDWRGQGRSGRTLRNPLKGHVRHFDDFGEDLDAVVRQILSPLCPTPWFALGHSMGGAISLAYVANRPGVFERLVLSAPMIDLAGLRSPNLLRAIARAAVGAGLGRSFIPVGRRRALFLSTFEGNVLTSDPDRFARTAGLLAAAPDLALGAPTIAWAHAAFGRMDGFLEDAFAMRMATPTLFVLAGADTVVDNRAAERLAARLRASAVVTILGARHELLMERDALRQQFWSAFDAFIPVRKAPDFAVSSRPAGSTAA